nr:hypothetical protein [Tanacetum cinerariifolium]
MIEEPMKPKKKDQIRLDEEVALKLQAMFDEESWWKEKKREQEKSWSKRLLRSKRWKMTKQKVENDKEKAKLKQLMETITYEEEVAIDAIPLVIKSAMIVGWKIYKEGKKSFYQIVRADGKSQMYMIFSQMLKSFDRLDLEDLYKLVKARYGLTRPVESMDYLLLSNMKIMFKPHVEDEV